MFRTVVLTVLAMLTLATISQANLPQKEAPRPIDPMKASLAEALENWVALLERDDPKTAADRWAADQKAADALMADWATLRKLHGQYDYRKWLAKNEANAGAMAIGDEKAFKVGGHEFGHRHIDWVKTDAGWRIAGVWACR